MDRMMLLSSDGHASARMEEYRDYLETQFFEDFDAYLPAYRGLFPRDFDRPGTKHRIDLDEYERWMGRTGDIGRLDGAWDVDRRLRELEAEGVVGEVLFPDFRRPFDVTPF